MSMDEMRQMVSMLQNEGGVAELMQRPVYHSESAEQPNVSQADLVADLFNIERMDIKRLADEVGVDISIQQMTPEKAAVMLEGMVKGQSGELIEAFNRLEEQRERVLAEMLDEDELFRHRVQKRRLSYASDPVPHDQLVEAGLVEGVDDTEEGGGEAEAEEADTDTDESDTEADE